jgi:MarR family transcriptional regulator for hemolysin
MRYVGRLLKFTAKEGSEVVERRLQAAGGSLPIWLILQTLGEQEGELQRQLAERLCIEGPTMTRHLDNLAADGLIERRPDPSDRRGTRVFATEEGASSCWRCGPSWNGAKTTSWTGSPRGRSMRWRSC